MRYTADLHIHSSWSMATGKNAGPESYYQSALIKGIDLTGTGDFTHPAHLIELNRLLEEDGSGLLKLKNPPPYPQGFSPAARDVRFIISGEISCIYKKNGKTRKIHSLIFLPDLKTAAAVQKKLDSLGNVKSDGRPILGLDVKELLDAVLNISEKAYMIPAHIWTPWFSLFGSRSGFDTIEECFEDLSPRIFSLETGLSADPSMIRLISALDRFTLVSFSDAHSPAKLGREASIFNTAFSYDGLFSALKTGTGLEGTIEFFPEEGKYHYDGHSACSVSFPPEEALKLGNRCPVCGKPLTLGTMHRVMDLADRKTPQSCPKDRPYKAVIPLQEIIAEVLKTGTTSKKAAAEYQKLINAFGSEFAVLLDAEKTELEKVSSAELAAAVIRMRKGEVTKIPGFDGEFGKIHSC